MDLMTPVWIAVMGLKIWQWGTFPILAMGQNGDGNHDAGGAEGLLMGVRLLVIGLKPQQPPSGCGPEDYRRWSCSS